ncbi:MAG: four helix bundle protein [Acidobacteria bacterium]|nr:four helix bundle protein [Acidobacteriota bacterium]
MEEKAIHLALDLIRVTNQFPRPEGERLKKEIRALAILLPGRITAGRVKGDSRAFLTDLHRAVDTLSRIELQILVSTEMGFLDRSDFFRLEQRILGMRQLGRGWYRGLLSRLRKERGP